jgi:hypothetical protein
MPRKEEERLLKTPLDVALPSATGLLGQAVLLQ